MGLRGCVCVGHIAWRGTAVVRSLFASCLSWFSHRRSPRSVDGSCHGLVPLEGFDWSSGSMDHASMIDFRAVSGTHRTCIARSDGTKHRGPSSTTARAELPLWSQFGGEDAGESGQGCHREARLDSWGCEAASCPWTVSHAVGEMSRQCVGWRAPRAPAPWYSPLRCRYAGYYRNPRVGVSRAYLTPRTRNPLEPRRMPPCFLRDESRFAFAPFCLTCDRANDARALICPARLAGSADVV